jgi:hypothetical protein
LTVHNPGPGCDPVTNTVPKVVTSGAGEGACDGSVCAITGMHADKTNVHAILASIMLKFHLH